MTFPRTPENLAPLELALLENGHIYSFEAELAKFTLTSLLDTEKVMNLTRHVQVMFGLETSER